MQEDKTRSATDRSASPIAANSVLDVLPVRLALVDADGRCRYWSPAAENFLGYAADAMVGRSIFEVLYPPDQSRPAPFVRRLVTTPRPRDVVLIRRDGHHVHARESVARMPLDDDRGSGYAIIYQDTTDLTHQIDRLALIHAISDLVQGTLKLDDLLHVILTCATAGTGLSFNRAFLLLLDDAGSVARGVMGVGPVSHEEADRVWTERDWASIPIDVLVEQYFLEGLTHQSPLDDLAKKMRISLDEVDHPIVRAIRDERTLLVKGEEARTAMARTVPSGITTAEEFVAAPFIARDRPVGVLIADNLFAGHAITVDDVSALSMLAGIAGLAIANARMFESEQQKSRRLEKALEDLRLAQKRLIQSERLAVIGRLSAHLAHEIRNPLTTIGLYLRAIEKRWDGGDANRDKLEVALDEIDHLEDILNQVLDFARPRPPVFGDCDPTALLEDVHRSITEEIQRRGIRVDIRCEPGLALRADTAQLRQVILNLVRNALHVLGDGGTLLLSCRGRDEGVEFQVTDNGPGIDPEIMGRIFEPFITTKARGSGLGLAICRKIIEDHGGRIEARSPAGGGTTIVITQPRRPRTVFPGGPDASFEEVT